MGARRTSTGSTVSRWLTTSWSISRTRFVPDGGESGFGIYSGLTPWRLATHAEVSHARTAPPPPPPPKPPGTPPPGPEAVHPPTPKELAEAVAERAGRARAA